MTDIELRQVFVYGLHPEVKLLGIRVLNNMGIAAANNCVYPANLLPHEPGYVAPADGAAVAHPNAGQIDNDALAIYLHTEAQTLIQAERIRLKGKPVINLTTSSEGAESPVPGQGSNFIFVTMHDVYEAGYSNMADYVYFVKGRSVGGLRTCRNCGGINHFSHKDGELICPTPENSVPKDLLMQVRYPVGVNPWRFATGKGKGKGKGEGDGSKG